MRRAAAIVLVVVPFSLALSASSALAQETPPGEKPGPTPPAPPAPPAEVLRVRGELERIEAERRKLAGDQAVLEEKARQLEAAARGLPTSPVLRPRESVSAITLRDAITRALANNADLLINWLVAAEAREQIPVERAAWDPTLRFSATRGRNRNPFFSSNPFSGLPAGLAKNENQYWSFDTRLEERAPTGTGFAIEYTDGWNRTNNSFSLNPTFQPRVRGEVSQNLLRGFGLEANLAGLRAAEADAEGADARYEQQLADVIYQVEASYWDVARAEEQLRTNESALRSAMELLNDQRKRKELGAATGLEVTIAEAGVTERREGVIVAENQLESARDQLIRVMEAPGSAKRYDTFVVPVDRPTWIEETEVDLDRAIETAIQKRPDYRAATLAFEAARQRAVQAENAALPTLDAFATFEEAGLGDTWAKSWRSWKEFYSWSVGVRLELPLFLRAERARARRAGLEVERTQAQLAALEAQVQLEVRKAIRDVRTARARIDAAKSARETAEKQLEAVKQEVRFGVSVPRQILDFQRDLASARSREVQAYIDYRLAHTALTRAQGLLVPTYGEAAKTRFMARDAGAGK